MSMKQKLYFMSICCFLFFACQNSESEKQLQQALSLSGDNRGELEKVLEHYKNDSLKLEAAKFLIRHMPGNMAYDSVNLYKYRPILLRYDSLKQREKTESINASAIINKEWQSFMRNKSPQSDIYSRLEQDLYSVSSDYLIKNIDQSFDSWQKTIFKDSVDFDAYLRYILPYRRQNGYVIEPWRDYFLSQYGGCMSQYATSTQAVDSLLEKVQAYQVNWSRLNDFPYIRLNDYRLSKLTRCSQRCWFNSMLLSALGIPCAIDFVPAWGNRNSSHEWNSIIIGGKTYSFEATGGKGKWKTQKVYNNEWIDEYWMKSRLPKVLRYSYESLQEGPSADKRSTNSNTPVRFLNGKYKDVSDEYFTTSDIKIPIQKGSTPKDAAYAYLFVYNEDSWKPVYWGEISSSEASFQKMGRDIVYLPGFYDRGTIVPFNDPFILKADGSIHYLTPNVSKVISVTAERKYYARPEIDFWKKWNEGASVEIANNRRFAGAKTIFTVPVCESRPNVWSLHLPVRTRYIRYLFPEHLDALAELSFYQKNAVNELELVTGSVLLSDGKASKSVANLFDQNILTYADLTFLQHGDKQEKKPWVGLDLGANVEIAAIGICPRNDKNNVIRGLEYELYFWNKDRWHSLGRKTATDDQLTYNNVPENSLLLLKCTTEGVENRIFTWEDFRQKWW